MQCGVCEVCGLCGLCGLCGRYWSCGLKGLIKAVNVCIERAFSLSKERDCRAREVALLIKARMKVALLMSSPVAQQRLRGDQLLRLPHEHLALCWVEREQQRQQPLVLTLAELFEFKET